MAQTTKTVLTADQQSFYMKARQLRIADLTAVLVKLGDSEDLPEGQGDTVKFVRYARLGLPFKPLTEGVPPAARRLAVTSVSKAVSQWGDYVELTDVAMVQLMHKPFQRALDRTGEQWGRLTDREVQRELNGNTQVYLANDRADRTALLPGDVMTSTDIQRMVAVLRTTGAPPHTGQFYVAVISPSVEQDLIVDPTFLQAHQYQNMTPLMDAEIGRWMGTIFYRSNHLPVIARNTNVNGVTTDQVAGGAETVLPNGVYTTLVTGLDMNGFEVAIGTTDAFTAGGGTDVGQIVLPAFPTGILGYNVYCSAAGGGAAGMTLQLLGHETAGSTVRISANGGANGVNIAVALTSSGAPAPLVPAVGVNIHPGYLFGKEFFATIKLGNMEPMITPAGPSHSNPLAQFRTVGWKGYFACLRTNDSYGWRFESTSGFDNL